MMHSQKLNVENSDIYFDTNHIQALKNDKNLAIYIIPVYYNNNNPDSNLYSISININEVFIDTKLTTQVINDDGSINFRSENFEYSNSKSKTAKINNLECYCTVSISECSCHTTHASGGCDHPNIAVSCTGCTGSASTSTSPNSEIIPNPYSSVINTVWSNNANYCYSYGLTGNTIYIALNKKFKPNYTFSSLQKFNIINNNGISGTLLEFLNIEGSTESNKNFVISIIDAVEDGTVTSVQDANVLINAYIETQKFMEEANIRMNENPTLFTSITPFIIEKNIDYTGLNPCSKEIFQKIKNTTVCDFANLFAKLGNSGSVYNTTINTAHNSVIINGQLEVVGEPANTTRTIPGIKYNYTVYVNPDYTGKTKLFIATMLLHEMAHAYFFSLVDDYNMGANNSFNEFPVLFNAAVVNKFPIDPNLHHEEIANSYVNAIADAIKEFQPGLSQQVYDDLAWNGLEKTSIFNKKYPQGSISKERVLNRKAAEQTGNSIAQGTPNEQTPMGQPCN